MKQKISDNSTVLLDINNKNTSTLYNITYNDRLKKFIKK